MNLRPLLVLLLALSVGGCASMSDRLIARLGGPERGFLTPAMLTDAGVGLGEDSANSCTAAGCPQAPAFCRARGYYPGSDAFNRCVVSVEQNLRTAHR
jgi:hypothetical protein